MLKAVIVDDDLITLNGLQKAVDWKGLDIEVIGTAQNGNEGLYQINTHQPDIILTDIFMPAMNGIEMLKQLREQGNEAEIVILSGYEDFMYARSAMKLNVNDYLSKPSTIDEIENAIKNVIEKVRKKNKCEREEKQLEELLQYNGRLTQKQLLRELLEPGCAHPILPKALKYLQMDLSCHYCSVIIIEFSKDRDRIGCKPSEWLLLNHAVSNIVDEMVQKNKGIYLADIQRNMITVIVSVGKEAGREYIERRSREIADEFLLNISSYLKIHVWAALGPVVDSTELIKNSYTEAINLLAERENWVDKRLISLQDLGHLTRKSHRRPTECYYALNDAVFSGDRESVEMKLKELTVTVNSMPGLSISAVRDFAVGFMGILMVSLYEHALSMEEILTDFNLYKELEGLYTVDDLEVWLRVTLLPVCSFIESRSTVKHKKTIDFIVRYIREHYAEDITLDIIAEKVFLTRNYLSQIFKLETGENYNNYLTRVRMDKAKELILKGNYKLYEIARMVGYKNTAYFSQLFKKYTGSNPSEINQ